MNSKVWCVINQGIPSAIFSTRKKAYEFWQIKDNEFREEEGDLADNVASPYEIECWALDKNENRFGQNEKEKENPKVYYPGGRASRNAKRVVLF